MMLFKKQPLVRLWFMQKAEQLVERDIHGNETVLQDLSHAYVDVGVLPTLTRKRNTRPYRLICHLDNLE